MDRPRLDLAQLLLFETISESVEKVVVVVTAVVASSEGGETLSSCSKCLILNHDSTQIR